MGGQRETRRGANVLYSGGDTLHSAQGEADFGNPNTPPGFLCHLTRSVLSRQFNVWT